MTSKLSKASRRARRRAPRGDQLKKLVRSGFVGRLVGGTILRAYHGIKAFAENPIASDGADLAGDREIEYSWIAARMKPGRGPAIDFGSGPTGYLGLLAAQAGYYVTAVDLLEVNWPFVHPQLTFRQGDLRDMDFAPGSIALMINCSAIEHVGLTGRYGVEAPAPDGDLEVMTLMRNLLRPDGTMLLTVPVGQDALFAPLHRVYGAQRLPRLLDGYAVEEKEFWTKNKANAWIMTDEEEALGRKPLERAYGLGCFVLRRS